MKLISYYLKLLSTNLLSPQFQGRNYGSTICWLNHSHRMIPAEANPCTTEIKTSGVKIKGFTDGNFDSCPHFMKQSTAALIQWQFQLSCVLPPQHRWKCTFPGCVCWLVLSQCVLRQTLAGKVHVSLKQARRQHNKQKPQKENSARAFSVLRSWYHMLFVLNSKAAVPIAFVFWSLLLVVTGLYRMNYRSIWNLVEDTLTEGENAGVIVDPVLSEYH